MCLINTKPIKLTKDDGFTLVKRIYPKDKTVFSCFGEEKYKVNKKYKAKKESSDRRMELAYEPGFHYFVDLDGAKNFMSDNEIIYRARFYGIYLEGTALGYHSRVAKFRVLKSEVKKNNGLE